MAKRKPSRSNSAPQDFANSPFKKLKGLSALADQGRVPVKTDELPDPAERVPAPVQDRLAFADEMDFLGVKPLPGRGRDAGAARGETSAGTSQAPLTREERDLAVFLEALGTLEKTFDEAGPEELPARQAAPRRLKQVARGQLKPEAELDLHGLSVDQAARRLEFFLQNAAYQGVQTVLVITGRGMHSNEGPVLRQAMEQLLERLPERVVEWGPAPRRLGGEGALLVFLRQPAAG